MNREVIGQQGEVKIYRIDAIPANADCSREIERNAQGAAIISHSESGHHHIIAGDVDLMERRDNVPAGMRIIYAIVKAPTKLVQTAAAAHGEIGLPESIYEFRVAREYDPFREISRRVAD